MVNIMTKKIKLNKKRQINRKNNFFWSVGRFAQLNSKKSLFCSPARRGQINQVFMFIMALLVMGLIVLIASKSLGGLIGNKCNVDLITFKEQIKEQIASKNDFGSITELNFKAPCDYKTLCVVDSSFLTMENIYPLSNYILNNPDIIPGSFMINMAVQNKVKNNIFLINDDGSKTIQAGYVKQLQLKNPEEVICFKAVAGSFILRTKGLGRNTQISLPIK